MKTLIWIFVLITCFVINIFEDDIPKDLIWLIIYSIGVMVGYVLWGKSSK